MLKAIALTLSTIGVSGCLGFCVAENAIHHATTGGNASSGGGFRGGGGSSGGAVNGSSSSGGGSSGGSSSGGAGGYAGSITFGLLPPGPLPGPTTYQAAGGFSDENSPIPCTPSPGQCCYLPPGLDAGVPTFSAGPVALTDNSAAIGTLTFSGGNYQALYESFQSAIQSGNDPNLTWQPGDTLGISAPGAIIDGFSATVTAPAPLAITQPSGLQTSSSYQQAVPLGSDFVLSWSVPATLLPDDSAHIGLSALSGSGSDGTITCIAGPTSLGTFTVPKSFLANFHSGDIGSVALLRFSTAPVPCANALLQLIATAESGGTVTYQ